MLIIELMARKETKTKKQLIKELKKLRKRVDEYEESVFDDLTGLHNIRYLLVLAEHEFTRAQRYKRPLSLVMLSLDNLEKISEIYGEDVVDKAFGAVVDYCRKNVRFVDIFGRYGDGEFLLLLPEAKSKAAEKMAERIRQHVVETPIPSDIGPATITISLGVANLKKDTPNLISLLERADKAMNVAREKEGDRVEVG